MTDTNAVSLLIYGYTREYNIPSVIIELCNQYYGNIDSKDSFYVEKLNLDWDALNEPIDKTINRLSELFYKEIEGNHGWKCILVRVTVNDGDVYGFTDRWYFYWFIENDFKTQDQSECIAIQLTN